ENIVAYNIDNNERQLKKNFIEKEIFIKKCKAIFGNKYSYDLVEYKNTRSKVLITCEVNKDHGSFLKRASSLLDKKDGCPKCSQQIKNNKLKMTEENFLKKCCERYGDKYDYSESKYIDYYTSIKIICKEKE